MSELRWNPTLAEWVITATHRQDRTFLPPKDYCPLCPTVPGSVPTDVPEPTYQIVSFDNRFPSLQRQPPEPAVPGSELYPVRPAQGVCEVILYSPKHDSTLAERSVDEIEQLIYVWADRTEVLGALPFVDYVFVFENKGTAVGVTISHPHGQIYGYPFVPPIPRREMEAAREYRARTGRCVVCDVVAEERREGLRLVSENGSFTAAAPFYARFPYELHLWSRRHLGGLPDLDARERRDLAVLLKDVLLRYDNLWGFSLPYMMCVHQGPTTVPADENAHLHFEFYPLNRTADKLKFLAGSESGAGAFVTDLLPEETAAQLRATGGVVPIPEETAASPKPPESHAAG